ncbi:TnpV protein [Clostridia bacterium OttesenSCG-928-F22]|nr:TnpV protein [Clostridia bacterium OttesenSCG-928-F22]
MDKTFFKEIGGTYTQVGDYLFPDLKLPEKETQFIGIWGERHLRYIRQHKRLLYTNLLACGKLNNYLADIDERAQEMFFRLVKQIAALAEITERLKAEKQMEWVAATNNIKNVATAIVLNEIIYN